MRPLTVFFFILSLNVTVKAVEENPDAGRLMRLVCYEVQTPGDLSTRSPHFTIVIQQDYTESDFDASFYIPGNSNYEDNRTMSERSGFTVKVYKNTRTLSTASEPQQLAEELLANPASHTYEANGTRGTENRFAATWDDGFSSVKVYPENPTATSYIDDGTFDGRHLWCEQPFSVPDPNAPAPAQVPQDQNAELNTNGRSVNSEL